MAKKKISKKNLGGRPKGAKNAKTRRWEYIRDSLYPSIAIAYGESDPNVAMAKWMNRSQENMDWFMKEAIMTMNGRLIAKEISDRDLEMARIQAEAMKPPMEGGGQGIGGTTINMLTTIPGVGGELAAMEPFVEAEVVETPIKQLPEPEDEIEEDDSLS